MKNFACNIEWETDGQDVDLPVDVELPDGIDVESIGEVEDYLSDEYGYLVNSFDIENEDEDEYDPDYLDIIEELDLNENMSCDEIFEKVFEYLDNNEDGQIPRSMLSTTADGITSEICNHFRIEFHKNEW
jgi:hypothetical protein